MNLKNKKFWIGKTVLITGGSSGIGFEIAKQLCDLAKHIILVSDNRTKLARAKSELSPRCSFSKILIFSCQIGSSVSVRQLHRDVISKIGCPDVIINNAGFAYFHTFEQMTEKEVDETANVNFGGFLRLLRAFVPDLIKSNVPKSIGNIASVAGAFPITPNSVYGGAKAGMLAFSELLGIELKRYGIRVTCICPGRVETDFFSHPSYVRRRAGSETRIVTPIDSVAIGTLNAIAAGKVWAFIPGFWRFFAWWLNIDRIFTRPIYRRFLAHRVERLYDQSNKGL